jgi:two-component system cell cycle sensor histidine kinase/response regulator CckA
VLVVEDDDAVRSYVRHVLERDGLTVVPALAPEEALRTLAGCGAIDLLLTDVRLPGLSGPQLAARVRARYPEVRVLFMSGDSADGDADPASDAVLHKPFTPHELTARVRRLLGRPAE